MKNLGILLAFIFMLNGCDDGDVTVDVLDFGTAVPEKCDTNNILYKINKNETMILLIPVDQDPYKNVVNTVSYPINANNQVLYRSYNGLIETNNICAAIQPGTPQISEEWTATAGTIVVTTTPLFTNPDPTTGAIKLTGYNHNIVFKNIVFQKPQGNQVYDEMIFGDYSTKATTLPFNFVAEEVEECATKNTIYNVALSRIESLAIENTDPGLIQNQVGIVTQTIGDTTNKLVYQLYGSALQLPVSDYFCGASTPVLPLVIERWTGQNGNLETATGIIQVITTEEGGGFSHEIRLKNVTFTNGNTTFYFGNDILYGILKTI